MFLVSAHTIYVHSSWKHCWRENQLPSFTEDKEVFLHVQDWWLYPVKTHSPTSEAQLPVHTKKNSIFFFKTHKIHSFLNSPPSQFSLLIPGRSVMNMWQHCTFLPSLLPVCLQEAHTVATQQNCTFLSPLSVCLLHSRLFSKESSMSLPWFTMDWKTRSDKGLFFYFPS